ncbi:hypothetical protein [Natrarchaeobaculum sulfurireducens]|uniref:Uncharacterized protein n=1 Tax=Natrarchaeobaculum sulfurireducens TaxID=2044521 RepID=A0A346PN56_9EURY|nr:hypothetical protein [Natrarchaeobaculum sulfurireducens]AXR79152.1 hypothetical protein AArc1_2840 [Natrarchaeobaculum sulfurireducens]AXR80951.1 hypothetical protein AArcMg_0930 [Natrarchaeobaculum sulfurireducens]
MQLGNVVTAAGFWVAIVLPVAYLPVFLAGIDSAFGLSVFLGLIAVNVVALVVGHEYPASQSKAH